MDQAHRLRCLIKLLEVLMAISIEFKDKYVYFGPERHRKLRQAAHRQPLSQRLLRRLPHSARKTRPDRLRVMPKRRLPVQRPQRPLKRMRPPARPLRQTAHQRLKPLKPTQLPVRLLQKTVRQRLRRLKPMPLPAKTLQQAVHRQPLSQKAPQRLRRSGRKMQPDKSTCQTIS